MTTFCDFTDATYSPEDDKLRLYNDTRLDRDLFLRLKDCGFRSAPKQGCFFATWTPEREDLCLELFGEINPEETTLVERAQAKADRLDGYSQNAAIRSNAFALAADKISERFYMGQPILVGHHSEKSARRDQKRMDNAMRNSIEQAEKVNYWNYRAEGVERNANRKSDPGVRARRMEKLFAELRDHQRNINHGFIVLKLWEDIKNIEDKEKQLSQVQYFVGSRLSTGSTSYYKIYSDFSNGNMTADEVITHGIEYGQALINSNKSRRYIEHLLNRLGYEQSELGEVSYYNDTITAAVLQTFARTHGAHKPNAEKVDNGWKLTSSVLLPVHLCSGNELTLTETEWRELMQSVGYTVPAKKPAKPPILNFKAQALRGEKWGNVIDHEQVIMTKEEYAKIYPDYRGTQLSQCGQFRFRVAMIKSARKAVFLSNQKAHEAPESSSIINDAVEAVEG